MAEDWASDVKKYAPDADDAVIAGIVRHCGIALRSRDASLVSFTDKAETDLVRESYCRKKLGLRHSDAELDAAIAAVGERMQADRTKNRVTVYYLLAEAFGKLGLFVAATGKAAAAAQPIAETAEAEPASVMPAAAATVAATTVAATTAAAPLAAASVPQEKPAVAHAPYRGREEGSSWATALITAGVLGAGIIVAAGLGGYLGRLPEGPPAAPAPGPTAASVGAVIPAAAPAPAVPTGSGVLAQDVAGKPQLSVYFDTASADVSPDFAAAAAPIKAYMDANPGAKLAVSGYNDPRGDAAMNAELSKNRAQSVQAALVALGVPATAIDLEKPPETTDADVSLENARRVDVMVRD